MIGSLPLRPAASLLAAAAVAALLAACGSSDQPPAASPRELRAGKPPSSPELREIRAQANRLLDGGARAFESRLAELRGHPIVVNMWASWCGPCRFEFPFFQRVAAEYGDRVAFLGVDSQDGRGDAEEFLDEFPTPYPHYFDPDGSVAQVFEGGRFFPTTVFYDAAGGLTDTQFGPYGEQAELEADVRELVRG